ncbi:RagB/SusD family nutrient uptake outer membrane protein [Hymenobacter cavernae]|uniref:Membrane protein n=1 Tax=Hymenobacter cavernae TaxID=2044852 RepID=A0ABQ1U6P6_9BACT|nr:RagB/SusD family nutrient uptake outer membrane protein [Hymenobacter cavernae]GGF11558.1 membrane protein [Hymenobacter cavernae]
MNFCYKTAATACAALLMLLTSCEKALDKIDLGSTNEALIFKDSTLADLNLSYIYDQNLPLWAGIGTTGLASTNPSILSDESAGESKYFEGTIQLNDVADFGTALNATSNYGKIRIINAFLAAANNGPLPQYTKNKLRAQAYFFRAWRYFDLVRIYGGVPLVLKPLDAVGPDAREATYLPRNTTAETFSQIKSDLDSAIMFLPGKWTASAEWGKITKGAAAAFKARVLLYAASPQFNPTDNQAKWQEAYDAGKQAVAILSANGAGLHSSFDQLWFQENNSNPEAVMITGFNTATGDQSKKSNSYDNGARPSYTGTGGGSWQPTWEMVKAFPMLDGKKPGESTKYSYSDQLFYKNRDPRFGKTIAYNGATWPLNGNTSYKVWTYFAGGKTVEARASNTGFYTRKAINPTVGIADAQFVGTDWIEIRYAEVLLNLAESACGVNNTAEGYTQLKAIRKRAGIEAGADGNYGLKAGMSRAEMFDAILSERQVEFAFEGKRFWDLRRWKLIEKTLNGKKRQGVTINLKTTGVPSTFAANRDNVDLDEAYKNYFEIKFKDLDTKYSINWKNNYYFFAIPQSAIDNNPSLVQNKDWGGAFDPLQ